MIREDLGFSLEDSGRSLSACQMAYMIAKPMSLMMSDVTDDQDGHILLLNELLLKLVATEPPLLWHHDLPGSCRSCHDQDDHRLV